MRAERRWAQYLRESALAGTVPPLPILAGFAEHYELLAGHAVSQAELTATFLEGRAAQRGSETLSAHLKAAAQDVRSGFHLETDSTPTGLYQHADGDQYLLLGTCAIKDDETGEWTDGVAYRAVSGPRHAVLCVTSQQRWDDRFESVA